MLTFIIDLLLRFLEFMVVVEAVCSWIPSISQSTFGILISKFTAPFLNPIRKILFRYMPNGFPLDISPIILFLLIGIVRKIIWVLL